MVVKGEVTNIPANKLDYVEVLVTFYTQCGSGVTTERNYLTYTSLLPDHTSTFRVYITYNPEMSKDKIGFIDGLRGTRLMATMA
jgi:hypothetical protein